MKLQLQSHVLPLHHGGLCQTNIIKEFPTSMFSSLTNIKLFLPYRLPKKNLISRATFRSKIKKLFFLFNCWITTYQISINYYILKIAENLQNRRIAYLSYIAEINLFRINMRNSPSIIGRT